MCDNEENGTTEVKQETRLGKCEVCSKEDAKYTCPKCEVKTCCLACQKIHKQELECDGIRDKTKYIPLNKFTDLDLASDYRLLEECGRAVEKHRKEGRKIHKPHLPTGIYNFKQAAHSRKIQLKILPLVFTRRKNNTSYYHFKEKTIFWRVEWIFPGEQEITLVDDKVCEEEKLNTVLSRHLKPQEDLVLQEHLQYYQSAGISQINLLLKTEKKAKPQFYLLDGDCSLLDSLRNKVIVEYPSIYVILKHNLHMYTITDSDDEEELTTNGNNQRHVIEKIIKSDEKETASVNYLFSTDQDLSD